MTSREFKGFGNFNNIKAEDFSDALYKKFLDKLYIDAIRIIAKEEDDIKGSLTTEEEIVNVGLKFSNIFSKRESLKKRNLNAIKKVILAYGFENLDNSIAYQMYRDHVKEQLVKDIGRIIENIN